MGHGGISSRFGKGTGAHGQAIFDLLLLLPRDSGLLLDFTALLDPSRLDYLSPRAKQALASLAEHSKTAMLEQRFAAIVIDERGTNQWTMVLFVGALGRDGHPGTLDDPYVRVEGPMLREPKALQACNGYLLDSPFAIVPKR
jgi:hypothetical protein